jgi:hypothetical protein
MSEPYGWWMGRQERRTERLDSVLRAWVGQTVIPGGETAWVHALRSRAALTG